MAVLTANSSEKVAVLDGMLYSTYPFHDPDSEACEIFALVLALRNGVAPLQPARCSRGVALPAVLAGVRRKIALLVAVAVNVAVAVLDVGGLGPDDGAASAEAVRERALPSSTLTSFRGAGGRQEALLLPQQSCSVAVGGNGDILGLLLCDEGAAYHTIRKDW